MLPHETVEIEKSQIKTEKKKERKKEKKQADFLEFFLRKNSKKYGNKFFEFQEALEKEKYYSQLLLPFLKKIVLFPFLREQNFQKNTSKNRWAKAKTIKFKICIRFVS